MQRVFRGALVLVVSLSAVAAGGGQDNPPTPAQQFKALLKEYDRASSSGKVLTGLLKRIVDGATGSAIGTPDYIAAFKVVRAAAAGA